MTPEATPDHRHPLDTLAVGAMVALSILWGFQQVAIKLAAHDISLVMQGALRSAIATLLLVGWALARRIPLWDRDGTLVPGLFAGAAFASEFALIYAGLAHTTAARMVIFLYVAPCLTALGLSVLVPGERLRPLQWAGVLLAFAGVVVAFADGFAATTGGTTLLGDAMGALAAVLWAATTVLIRATRLARISATKVLFYQLGVSAALLPLVSHLSGEPGIGRWTPVAIASLAYQSAIVAFASYLAWFWLLTRYLAGRLAVFSFVTPLAGVAFGRLVLEEPVSLAFLGAAAMVGAGIALVNAGSVPPAARSPGEP
jgi:drug/metabolite transporter (DMT)-like permease